MNRDCALLSNICVYTLYMQAFINSSIFFQAVSNLWSQAMRFPSLSLIKPSKVFFFSLYIHKFTLYIIFTHIFQLPVLAMKCLSTRSLFTPKTYHITHSAVPPVHSLSYRSTFKYTIQPFYIMLYIVLDHDLSSNCIVPTKSLCQMLPRSSRRGILPTHIIIIPSLTLHHAQSPNTTMVIIILSIKQKES